MEPIRTLFDHAVSPGEPTAILPSDLCRHYDGDLRFPTAPEDRPYVIGNFVSTLDGVVSYQIPGHAGGGEISGHNQADRFIMGLLRASADAIMVGSGTLHATAADHLWIPEYIYPEAAEAYKIYRQTVLRKPDYPSTVIVSANGVVDLDRAVFRTSGINVQIVTTRKGRDRLIAAGVDRLGTTEVTVFDDSDLLIAPAAILKFLRTAKGVRLLLHEGGPTLFGQFVAAGLVDEFFLTVAPQIAGRNLERPRPAMVWGTEFLPETAPWLRILSVKQNGDHLCLRYDLAAKQGPPVDR
jgi:riboflavin biosynthesis pyrimidine reductase